MRVESSPPSSRFADAIRARSPFAGWGWLFSFKPRRNKYRLLMDGGPGPEPAQPVRVVKEDEALVVTTGDRKVEIPRKGGMPRRGWRKGELVLEQKAGHGNWLTTAQGVRHSE